MSAKNVDWVIAFSSARESRYYGARLAAQSTTIPWRKIARRRDRSADVPVHMTRLEREYVNNCTKKIPGGNLAPGPVYEAYSTFHPKDSIVASRPARTTSQKLCVKTGH